MNQKDLPAVSENAINMDAWNEWLDYRKEKRKPVSERAQAKQWRVLALYSHEVQQQIIDRSIMNDWQGLFPPPTKANHPAAPKESTRERSIEMDLLDRSWAE